MTSVMIALFYALLALGLRIVFAHGLKMKNSMAYTAAVLIASALTISFMLVLKALGVN